MAIRNLLKESILEVKKLKQASAENTKDRLLEKLTSDLKKKLRQQNDQEMLLDDEEITEDQQILDDFEDEETTEDQQMIDDQQIASDLDDQIQEAIDDLQNDQEEITVQNEESDEEIQDIITQLEGQQDQEEIVMEDDDLEDDDLEDDDLEDEDDEALIQRIKSILESEGEEEDILSDQEEIAQSQQDPLDEEIIESFRKKVKQLTTQNRKYKNSLKKINSQLNQTKCLQMKGNYAIKLFNKFNLSKDQKMTIIENFDRAKNERQIKLVYATLFQGLKDTNVKKPIRGKKPIVSSKIKSTRSRVRQSRDIIQNDYQPISEIFRRKVGILN